MQKTPMPQMKSDDDLRRAGLTLLQEELGPVDALRFVSLLRREPFDYQTWREETFAGLSTDELFQRLQEIEARRS